MCGGSFDHVIVCPLVRIYLHHLHFVYYLRNVLYFVLVAEEVDKEVKVLQIVLPFVKEGLEVCIDSLVYFAVVVFLVSSSGTSYKEEEGTGYFEANVLLRRVSWRSIFLPNCLRKYP